MRFVLTLVCMAVIVVTVTAIAIIDLLMRLLPALIVAAVVAAVWLARRRRARAGAPQLPSPAIANVPDEAAFRAAAAQPRAALHSVVSPGHPVTRYMVIDGDATYLGRVS